MLHDHLDVSVKRGRCLMLDAIGPPSLGFDTVAFVLHPHNHICQVHRPATLFWVQDLYVCVYSHLFSFIVGGGYY